MKSLRVPEGGEKPSWGGLFGAVPMLYLFWEPYQKNAAWPEWLWTSLAFVIFVVLAILASIYWSRKQVMQGVCFAIAVLALAFTAYRPSGIIFFIYLAALAPLAAAGNIPASAAIVGTAVLFIFGEWALFWPPSFMPYAVAAEALAVGSAITVVIRQQIALRQTLKAAERERIARDLHDILGHTLSVIILKSELASRLLDQDPARAKEQIEDLERISRNALSEVRDAIKGYHAVDLLAELDRAQSTLETAGLRVERHCDPVDMPAAHERVLALVLREAITNVVRHAHAKRCSMILRKTNDGYRLAIRDDGRGGRHEEGMGMQGIRERVKAIGGEVLWNTNSGTELVISLRSSTTLDGRAA